MTNSLNTIFLSLAMFLLCYTPLVQSHRRAAISDSGYVLDVSAAENTSTRQSGLDMENVSSRSTVRRPVQVAMMNCAADAMRSSCHLNHKGEPLILQGSQLKLTAFNEVFSLKRRGMLAFPVDKDFWKEANTLVKKKLQEQKDPKLQEQKYPPRRKMRKKLAKYGNVAIAGAVLTNAINFARDTRARLEEEELDELSKEALRLNFSSGGTLNQIGKELANFLEALFGPEYIAVPMNRPYFRFNYENVQRGQGKAATDFHADACGFVKLFLGEHAVKSGPTGTMLGCSSQAMPFDSFFAELSKRLFERGKRLDVIEIEELKEKVVASGKELAHYDPWNKEGMTMEVLKDIWGAPFVDCLNEQATIESLHPWIDKHVSMYNLHFLTVEDANQALAVLPRQSDEILSGPDRYHLNIPCEIAPSQGKATKLDLNADALTKAKVLERETDAWIFQALGHADVAPEIVATIHAAVQVVKRGGEIPTRNRESIEFRSIVMDTKILPRFFDSVWEVCGPTL